MTTASLTTLHDREQLEPLALWLLDMDPLHRAEVVRDLMYAAKQGLVGLRLECSHPADCSAGRCPRCRAVKALAQLTNTPARPQ